MAPGASSEFRMTTLEPEIFRKQMKALVTLLGLFGALRSHSPPGELCSLSPLVTSLCSSAVY